ncbi:MAG: energy transducer TonB, partial [Luteimonas sp.]|nr:energy transducer TonB [Luteimonas sp.]
VQPSCKIDLAAWGERNAITVAEARARDDKDMLFDRPGDPASYWTGTTTPGRYPADAARYGAQGCVVVGFRIGVDGVPGDFRILSSALVNAKLSRFRRQFEQATLAAASAWRFSPGPDNLERRPQFMQVPMGFHLGTPKAAFACNVVDLSGGAGEAVQ